MNIATDDYFASKSVRCLIPFEVMTLRSSDYLILVKEKGIIRRQNKLRLRYPLHIHARP